MEEARFSDFGDSQPSPGTRRLSRCALASMVLGLAGPFSCMGGLLLAAPALEASSFSRAVVLSLLPTLLAIVGLLLGAIALFFLATRPQRTRGAGFAVAGVVLNLLAGALGVLLVTQLARVGSVVTTTAVRTIRAIEQDDADALRTLLHPSAADLVTPERLSAFKEQLDSALGPVDRGVKSLGELMEVHMPSAASAVASGKTDQDLPGVPVWFAHGRALVVLSLDEGSTGQLLSVRLHLDGLITDVRIVSEDGRSLSLLHP